VEWIGGPGSGWSANTNFYGADTSWSSGRVGDRAAL